MPWALGSLHTVTRSRVQPLSDEALASLTTQRLLAYRKSLLSLEDSATRSDLAVGEAEALEPGFIYFKDDPTWQRLYAATKRILNEREHE